MLLEYTNLEEYTDAEIYDNESSGSGLFAEFYLALAREIGEPVLELGCGTGHITIPLAQHGIDITGLDAAPAMLERARSKSKDLPIRWIDGDIRTFRIDRQFRFIFTLGAVFQHLLSRADQEAMFARIREHLAPGGQVALDIHWQRPKNMVDVDEEKEWQTYADAHDREVRVSGTDHYDHLRQIWYQTVYRRCHDAEGKQVVRRTQLALRYIFPQEMEALLHYNGFRVVHRYGDWELNEMTEASENIIYVCDVIPN